MAKRNNDETLIWNEVDTETFKPATAKLYKAYKEAQADASAKRQAFDDAFEKTVRAADGLISETQTLLVTHKYGKLSFAVSDELPSQGKKSKKFSFS